MKKILIIEDSKKTSLILKEVLEKMSYSVFLEHDGVSGLAAARREKPDLILLDLLLPKISGFDVCKSLKQDNAVRSIPVIILSTMYNEENVQKMKLLGAVTFMKKPYRLEELLEEIKKRLKDE
ncbi:MAG: response regulator [Elusimicrobia bacterium]|nr:response regulator [Elusimicrobiota bacterium]